MLKNRIKKIENALADSKINYENIYSITEFLKTGNYNALPDKTSFIEFKIAALKIKSEELSNYTGLRNVLNFLLEEGEINNEKEFFDYLRSRSSPKLMVVTTHDGEEMKDGYAILKGLGLYEILHIHIVRTIKE